MWKHSPWNDRGECIPKLHKTSGGMFLQVSTYFIWHVFYTFEIIVSPTLRQVCFCYFWGNVPPFFIRLEYFMFFKWLFLGECSSKITSSNTISLINFHQQLIISLSFLWLYEIYLKKHKFNACYSIKLYWNPDLGLQNESHIILLCIQYNSVILWAPILKKYNR